MNHTNIEWARNPGGDQGFTWDPVTGCSRRCPNCYAQRLAEGRLRGRCGYPEVNPFNVTLHEDRLTQPAAVRKPSGVFVCSMGDLFDPNVPPWFLLKVFHAMQHPKFRMNHHRYYLLTKRPDRIIAGGALEKWRIWPNIWLGVSVSGLEDLWRVEELVKIPAAVRFVSYEPALAEINFEMFTGMVEPAFHWLIAGPETGPERRPYKLGWFRSIRDQARAAGIPFFLKALFDEGGRRVSLPELDGRRWEEMPNESR